MTENLTYIAEALRPLAVPVGELHEDPTNPRKGHAVDRIAASLKTYGQRKPIVANRAQNGKIEAGNGTYRAAKSLGWSHIAVVWVDDDATTAAGYGIADNRLGDLSEWDTDVLADVVGSLDDMFTGFTVAELDELLPDRKPAGDDPGAQVDKAAELQAKWGTATGQLWQLGEHRLICGDCTDAAVVARVMGGEKAQAVVTDPPYGMNYQDDAGGRVANDRLRDFRRLLHGMPALLFSTGANQIAVWTRWDIWREVHDAFERIYPPCGMIVWDKQNLSHGNTNHFGNSHELCYVSAPGDWVMKVDGKRPFSVITYQVTSNRMDGDERRHLTQKPLKVIDSLVQMLSEPAGVVVDLFLGSGTTLIACERLGRRCRAVEIEPGYVAVALERWATMTGKTPVLVAGGAA